jgi:hypothetical protein
VRVLGQRRSHISRRPELADEHDRGRPLRPWPGPVRSRRLGVGGQHDAAVPQLVGHDFQVRSCGQTDSLRRAANHAVAQAGSPVSATSCRPDLAGHSNLTAKVGEGNHTRKQERAGMVPVLRYLSPGEARAPQARVRYPRYRRENCGNCDEKQIACTQHPAGCSPHTVVRSL